jgi:hypothetical protein
MRGRDALVLSAIIVLTQAGRAGAQSNIVPLSPEDTATACAPTLAMTAVPDSALRIIGAQDTVDRNLFGVRDLVIVNGGTQAGVQVGQDYFIRRAHRFGRKPAADAPRTIVTAGWLRIVALNETTAVARIDSVCDSVQSGDYLEAFAPPARVAAGPQGAPFSTLDFSSLARVMYGTEARRLADAGAFMLLERGNAPLAVGSQVAVYRDLRAAGVPLTAVAEGVIVAVSSGTPVMRITSSRDAVQSGDYVVPRK